VTDGQTDRRKDRQTDNGAKNNMSPHYMGGDIMNCETVILSIISHKAVFTKNTILKKYKKTSLIPNFFYYKC